MSDELNVIGGKSAPRAVCLHLLSKGMYINAGMPEGQEIAGDGHIWCQKTAESLGPDRQGVNREVCVPGRDCFESVV